MSQIGLADSSGRRRHGGVRRCRVIRLSEDHVHQLTLIDDVTGETVGTPFTFGEDFFSVEVNDDGSLVAAGLEPWSGVDGDGHIFVFDGSTGEELYHVVSKLPAAQLVFDGLRNELVAGIVDGSLMTIDLATGDIIAEVDTQTDSQLLDLEVQPDGTIMVVSEGQVEFVDRQTGPTSETYELRNIAGARTRPDDLITTFAVDGRTNVVDLRAANSLVDKRWTIPTGADVTIVDGRAGVVAGPSPDIEVIELESGERHQLQLTDADGSALLAAFVSPEPDGVWAFDGSDRELVRFEDDVPVQRFDVPEPAGFGFAIGDAWGLTTQDLAGAATTATLVSMDRRDPGIALSIPSPDALTAYPHPDGGLMVMDSEGQLRRYDSRGQLLFEQATALRGVLQLSVDSASGKIAMSPGRGGLTILDPLVVPRSLSPSPIASVA